MGSTGIGNGIAIPHGKLEEDTLRAVGVFVQLETPIAFDAIDNQPVDLLLPCWCRQTKLKRTCILCRWWRNVWRTKPSAAVYAQPRAMKSCIKSLRIPKVLRMKRSYSVMSLFRRCEEKQYMVLMIVSGRSGSGKSVACVRWKIWVLLRG